MEKATFGAGCFWGIEAAYRQIKGVRSTRVGFMGGHVKSPTYKQVCQGDTGHIEVVEVTFDPKKVSYQKLLEVFWSNIEPTQVNRQGSDHGEQYQSIIFYHDMEQKKEAENSKHKMQEKYNGKVATLIKKAQVFYQAEDYHQQYLEKKGLSTCHI